MTDTDDLIRREQQSQAALEKLLAAYDALDKADEIRATAFRDSQTAIAEAHHAGVSMGEIREVTELTRQRVYQIYESWRMDQVIAENRARIEEWASQHRGKTLQQMLDEL